MLPDMLSQPMTWNLRRKILAGYLAAVALAAMVLGLALVNIVRLGDASDAILRENYRSILAAEEMINELQQQENASLLLVLGAGPETRPDSREAEQRFLIWLARAKSNITIEGEAAILQRIDSAYADYLVERARFRQMLQEERANGLAIYQSELAPRSELVHAACKELYELNRRTMEESSRRAQMVAHTAVASTAIVGALLLGAGIVFSVWMARLIVRPLAQLTEVTEKVASGDYDVSIQPQSRDEIGQLAERFNVMVAKLRAYRDLNLRRIVGEQKKAAVILNTIDDGVLVIDNARKVASLNPAARKALGVANAPVEGAPFAEVIHDERLRNLVEDTLRSGKAPLPKERHDFVTMIEPDDRHLHYDYSLAPIAGSEGAAIGLVVLFRNVTKLKELDRLKTEFVMTASHELRTPLTGISMSIELLRERLNDKVAEADRQLLDVAHVELARLRKLVEELLNLSKIESGRLEMEFAVVSLDEILQAAVSPFQAQAEHQGLELVLEIEKDIPPIEADPTKFAWVVTNLIGNALRYARGHIWVSAARAGEYVNIYVRDDGPGIPHELQARIFDKFVQTGGPEHAGGAGLGLAIAKEIVHAHGGHIWVESESGHGSVFIVTLPFAVATSAAKP
jgi:NtrC-family two-component system sensor histidine kinase KinB